MSRVTTVVWDEADCVKARAASGRILEEAGVEVPHAGGPGAAGGRRRARRRLSRVHPRRLGGPGAVHGPGQLRGPGKGQGGHAPRAGPHLLRHRPRLPLPARSRDRHAAPCRARRRDEERGAVRQARRGRLRHVHGPAGGRTHHLRRSAAVRGDARGHDEAADHVDESRRRQSRGDVRDGRRSAASVAASPASSCRRRRCASTRTPPTSSSRARASGCPRCWPRRRRPGPPPRRR